jgi:hypothetical protein
MSNDTQKEPTSLVPEDANEVIANLKRMQGWLQDCFDESLDYTRKMRYSQSYASAVQAELELRRQMVLEEQRQIKSRGSKPPAQNKFKV